MLSRINLIATHQVNPVEALGHWVEVVVTTVALAGCSAPSPYQRVFEHGRQATMRQYPASLETCQPAVKRAALGLHFTIDEETPDKCLLKASRYFQHGPRTTTIMLKANLQAEGEMQTAVYLTAVEMSERVFARSHRRFLLWLIPLPGGGGVTASRVTESLRTIEDEKFYEAFFDAVRRELERVHPRN